MKFEFVSVGCRKSVEGNEQSFYTEPCLFQQSYLGVTKIKTRNLFLGLRRLYRNLDALIIGITVRT